MLDHKLTQWLDTHADHLDCGESNPEALLTQLANAGILGLGVAAGEGGAGGNLVNALEALIGLAKHSLTAAFVYWGQRAFIEYMLQSENHELRACLLKDLLSGKKAGATGLSNAMKYLSGIEELGISATKTLSGWELQGRLPWVTNLRKSGFVVAAAIDLPGEQPFIAALPDNLAGLVRSEDLQLLGLQCSNTAAIDISRATLGHEWVIATNAHAYLQTIRPAFLGLQCGLAIGLAQRSLKEAGASILGSSSILKEEWLQLTDKLRHSTAQLFRGLAEEHFISHPVSLFKLRIIFAELAAAAVQLELQAGGGKAYLQPQGKGFARRLRESAFIPVVTPSLVQLRTELQRHFAEAVA